MPADKVVVNASPLILLFNSDQAFILPGLFTEVVVPEAVWREVVNTPALDKAAHLLPVADWITRVAAPAVDEVTRWDLGSGETAVLSFAANHPDYRPVLDDQAAKKCALALQLRPLGTGSILILAKENKLIDSVGESLAKLRSAGMWVSDSVVQLLQRKAGE